MKAKKRLWEMLMMQKLHMTSKNIYIRIKLNPIIYDLFEVSWYRFELIANDPNEKFFFKNYSFGKES